MSKLEFVHSTNGDDDEEQEEEEEEEEVNERTY
jgi:hypothetical protein